MNFMGVQVDMRRFLWVVVIFLSTFAVSIVHAETSVKPLVDVDWLQSNLENKNLVVLDIRSPRKSRNFYAEGHIDGAISAPYNEGWRKTVDGVIGMLPPVSEISAHIGSLGIGNESHVVVVPFGNSSTDFSAATRIYWTFKVLGHDQVSILDGGYAAWLANGGRLSKKATVPKPRQFRAELRSQMIATEQDVKEALSAGVPLVDARPAAQYEGKAKSPVVSRAGTIPTALNLRQSSLYSSRKAAFVGYEKVHSLVSTLGSRENERAITFCNTGHWASIVWFAMSEIAGQENVSLYDGSMTEWTAEEANPVQ